MRKNDLTGHSSTIIGESHELDRIFGHYARDQYNGGSARTFANLLIVLTRCSLNTRLYVLYTDRLRFYPI